MVPKTSPQPVIAVLFACEVSSHELSSVRYGKRCILWTVSPFMQCVLIMVPFSSLLIPCFFRVACVIGNGVCARGFAHGLRSCCPWWDGLCTCGKEFNAIAQAEAASDTIMSITYRILDHIEDVMLPALRAGKFPQAEQGLRRALAVCRVLGGVQRV